MKKKKPIFTAAGLIVTCAALLLLCGGATNGSRKPVMAVRYPVETGAVLHNPYTGFTADARDPDHVLQPVTLVHANLSWRELEPEPGAYDFEGLEETFHFQYWKEQGVRFVLRVVLDYPREDRHLDIPDWLYKETGEKGRWYDLPYGKGFSPDYSSPVLIASHRKLIEALALRYGNDPAVAFIQLGSIGHWGEWHTMNSGTGRIPFPARSITDQYIEPYVQYFSGKPLLMRRPTAAGGR
ncbi:beta-galactosidase, partial [Paenibacillus forsythiae]|uniref:beta-galactosidase n=1 Tax=Paenibacillus forsythiae TaxID=365616 RepID=UPI000470ED8F